MHEQIQTMITHSINQIPQPLLVTITKVYDDQNHVDATTQKTDEELTYIATIGTPVANQKGLLMFLENDEMVIITK